MFHFRESRPPPNDFLNTVCRIAESEGYAPSKIVHHFKKLNSSHFICGQANDHKVRRRVPSVIWRRVSDHYNPHHGRPYRRVPITTMPTLFKEKSMVFISDSVTDGVIRSKKIAEQLLSPQRLFQYLNWTMRMSKVITTTRCNKTHSVTHSETMVLLKGRNGGRFLLFNLDLHDQHGERLYALCTPNDIRGCRNQEWQLGDLLTAPEITQFIGIRDDDKWLPVSFRQISPQMEAVRMMKAQSIALDNGLDNGHSSGRRNVFSIIKGRIAALVDGHDISRYHRLKCIRTGSGRKQQGCNQKQGRNQKQRDSLLVVEFSTFHDAVSEALRDDQVDLIPIVSVVSRRNSVLCGKEEGFSVDYLLPVLVKHNWIGVVYREFRPSMVLMDRYDITNKALLCDPSFDPQSLEWFTNSYHRIKIASRKHVLREFDQRLDANHHHQNYQNHQNPNPLDTPMAMYRTPKIKSLSPSSVSLNEMNSVTAMTAMSGMTGIREESVDTLELSPQSPTPSGLPSLDIGYSNETMKSAVTSMISISEFEFSLSADSASPLTSTMDPVPVPAITTMTPLISGGRGIGENSVSTDSTVDPLSTVIPLNLSANANSTVTTVSSNYTQPAVPPQDVMITSNSCCYHIHYVPVVVEPLTEDTPKEQCLQWLHYTNQVIQETEDEAMFFGAIYQKTQEVISVMMKMKMN